MAVYSKIEKLPLAEYAHEDFEAKMTAPVHGHSIDDEWTEAMYQPIGLDKSMEPVSLNPDNESPLFEIPYGLHKYNLIYEAYYNTCKDYYYYNWQDTDYTRWLDNKIKVVVGDITRLRVDAIVNAANTCLLDTDGVSGAIHQSAGPELLEECKMRGECKIGTSLMTDAYNLPCKKIIHTVGPMWNGDQGNEDKKLTSCYRTALYLAQKNNIKSIAFTCISTGARNFPKERAAKIAVLAVRDFLLDRKYTGDVIFCCLTAEDAEYYTQILNKLD